MHALVEEFTCAFYVFHPSSSLTKGDKGDQTLTLFNARFKCLLSGLPRVENMNHIALKL